MPKVKEVYPNVNTHAEFAVALDEAKRVGVQVLNLACQIAEDSISI